MRLTRLSNGYLVLEEPPCGAFLILNHVGVLLARFEFFTLFIAHFNH